MVSLVYMGAKLLQSYLTLCNPTAVRQTPLSTGFYRQEYWSGFPCPTPGGLPDPGIKPMSLLSPALGGGSFFCSPVNYSEVYTSVALAI